MLKKLVSQLFGPKDFSVGLIQEMLVTLGKFGFSPDMAKQITNAKSGMAEKIVELFTTVKKFDPYEFFRKDWQLFYQKYFNLTVDFSNVRIPECPGNGWRLLIIVQGLMPELVFQVSRKIFGKAWKYYDASLDEVVVRNERDSKNGSYAIWVRDGQEADEIHKNKSANQVEKEKLSTETLLERFVHGLKYFQETGDHLDINNITLCSGSRYFDGDVPSVHWFGSFGRLSVFWYNPYYADDNLRPREVVS